jgi:hypothetical protein
MLKAKNTLRVHKSAARHRVKERGFPAKRFLIPAPLTTPCFVIHDAW